MFYKFACKILFLAKIDYAIDHVLLCEGYLRHLRAIETNIACTGPTCLYSLRTPSDAYFRRNIAFMILITHMTLYICGHSRVSWVLGSFKTKILRAWASAKACLIPWWALIKDPNLLAEMPSDFLRIPLHLIWQKACGL